MSYKSYLAIPVSLGVAIVVWFVLSLGWPDATPSTQIDRDLAKAIKQFNLQPLEVRRFEADPKYKLGQALFFDPVLSGPRDVSCSTCHLLQYGTSDGLSQSIGVHGVGLSPERRLIKPVRQHPRHALNLWNRDNNAVRALFWDGRIEILNSERRIFGSPLGKDLPPGLENILAVQALFPLVTTEEMLGEVDDRSATDLPKEHAGLLNELVTNDPSMSETSRMEAPLRLLMTRLLGAGSMIEWQERYRVLFHNAYRSKNIFTVADLANAIAHFEEMAFATRDSAWDRYLSGRSSMLSDDEKRGALIFYGKGRCAVCHSGPLFSDFKYHSIGVFGVRAYSADMPEDFGRWNATHEEEDRYKFRTPPLRNVTKTSPYFHDGSEPSLRAAIIRHFDPLEKATKYNPDGSFAINIRQINAVSPVLVPSIRLSEKETGSLLSFLSALDYQPTNVEDIVPKSVPSGLPIGQP